MTLTARGSIALLSLFSLALGGCPWSDNAAQDGMLRLSGTVEAHETDLAFQVAGRIEKLPADEGMAVTPDMLIAQLDATDYQLTVQRLEAEATAAEKALDLLKAGARIQELRVAEAAQTRAQSELKYAEGEHRRVKNLAQRNLASPDQLDQARLREDVARSALEQARQNLQLLREGARREEIERAEAELAARRAALESARRQRDYTRLMSGVSGYVTVRMAEAGEVVAPGQPVVRVAQLDRPWIRAYLSEADLARVRLGQKVRVTADGVPDHPFDGTLVFIASQAEFTPKTVETRELRVDLVYRIKVEVDNRDGLLKLGMPADVAIETASAS